MSRIFDKKTMRIISDGHTPAYEGDSNYLINPVLPTDEFGNLINQKYWKLNTAKDKVLEMTALQKKAVDDAIAETAKINSDASTRESLIQKRMHDNAETELIAEEVINAIQ